MISSNSHDRTLSRLQISFGVVLTLGLLAGGIALPVSASESLTGDALVQRVNELATAALDNPGAVGLSVAIAVGDDVLMEKGFGLIEVEHDVAANGDSVFRIGSITKQFTAAAVMKLIEDGSTKDGKTLTLDAPMTDFVDFPTQGHDVTVRHLLAHTSGIKSYTGLGEEWLETIPLELSDEQLLDLVKDKDFDFAPNEEWRYNNTGYYLLGMLIEEVSGKDYGDYLAESFFEPLDLTHLRYGSNSAIIRNRAQGYAMADGERTNDMLIGMSQPGAAGALISNAGDLVRWNLSLVNGNVVKPESYQLMTTEHTLDDGSETGYGFGLSVGDFEGRRRVGHGGGINGFNSMLSYYPESGLTIAVISNSEAYNAGRLADTIAREAFGVTVEIKDLEISATEIERVSGHFTLTGTPLEFHLFERDGTLIAAVTGQGETRLRLQGETEGATEYRPDLDDSIRLVFAAGSPAPHLTLFQGGAEVKGPRKE